MSTKRNNNEKPRHDADTKTEIEWTGFNMFSLGRSKPRPGRNAWHLFERPIDIKFAKIAKLNEPRNQKSKS
jgi:hypothetical protein